MTRATSTANTATTHDESTRLSGLRRAYADTDFGQLHHVVMGSGSPVLLLHQTPRSWDEFRELMPLLAVNHTVIAMDMLGFGASPTSIADLSVENIAAAAYALMDALHVERFHLLGHHTGAAVALEMAAARPDAIVGLVLSASTLFDEAYRAAERNVSDGVDEAEYSETGEHLLTLWNWRRPYYPSPPTDLLNRFISDALRPGVDPKQGHDACGRYHMDTRIERVTSPVLLIEGEADPFANAEPVRTALTHAESATIARIPGGRVPLMEHCAAEVADLVLPFLATHDTSR